MINVKATNEGMGLLNMKSQRHFATMPKTEVVKLPKNSIISHEMILAVHATVRGREFGDTSGASPMASIRPSLLEDSDPCLTMELSNTGDSHDKSSGDTSIPPTVLFDPAIPFTLSATFVIRKRGKGSSK
jgi:hypothetical protein